MTTINSIQTLANKQPILTITVTIGKQFESNKPVGNATYNKVLNKWGVRDSEGTSTYLSCMSLIEKAPQLQEGQTVTLSCQPNPNKNGQMEGVTANEYNGKVSININGFAKIEHQGGGTAPPTTTPAYVAPATTPAPQAAPAAKQAATKEECVDAFLKLYGMASQKALAVNATPEQAHELGLACLDAYSKHWFGEKGIK